LVQRQSSIACLLNAKGANKNAEQYLPTGDSSFYAENHEVGSLPPGIEPDLESGNQHNQRMPTLPEKGSPQELWSPHMSISQFFDFGSPMATSCEVEIRLMLNLPYYQLQHLLQQRGKQTLVKRGLGIFWAHILTKQWIEMILGAPYLIHSSQAYSSLEPFIAPPQTILPCDERQKLLSVLVLHSSQQQLVDRVKHFSDCLRSVVPERFDGDVAARVSHIFDARATDPLTPLFELAAYLSSNQKLTDLQLDNFLKYIIGNHLLAQLRKFLQINTPTIHAFVTKLLHAGIRIKSTEFLRLLIEAGIKFDSMLETLWDMNNLEFFEYVLSKVSPESLAGQRGGSLLHKVASTRQVGIARILIQHDAHVDTLGRISVYHSFTTPLYQAVWQRDLDMVSILLKAGADVNKIARGEAGLTVFGYAVRSGSLPIVKLMLQYGADPSHKIEDQTILQWSSFRQRAVYKLLTEKSSQSKPKLTAGDLLEAADRSPLALRRIAQQHTDEDTTYLLELALCESVIQGKIESTIELLRYGVSPNCCPKDDYPINLALGITNEARKFRVCQLLIQTGADINIPGLLRTAAGSDDVAILRLFVDAGADLEEHGPEAIEEAAGCGDIMSLVLLLDRKVDINAMGRRTNALQSACAFASLEMIEYLINRGADINAPPNPFCGRTALQAAVETDGDDWAETIKFLLLKGADASAPPALVDGVTVLEAAAPRWYDDGWQEIFGMLLDAGAPVSRPDGRPIPILHSTIKDGNMGNISRALLAGVSCTDMSKVGDFDHTYGDKTPLQLAAEIGKFDIVKLLVERGVDVNEAPSYEYGRTTLQAAVCQETPDLVLIDYLLQQGADIHAQPAVCGGVTALQGAAMYGNIDLVKMLILKGADVNAAPAPREGRYAIEAAAEHGRLDTVQLLINAGAKGDTRRGTGFKSAIQFAKDNEHFAIANILKDAEKGKAVDNAAA
jgi:ankyrin repeat protein